MKLLIATHNRGKRREYLELLDLPDLELSTLDDIGITHDIEESGTTFAENARLKAETYALASGLLTLADDSGLEVDALGGAPGVHSRRYAGEGKSDADRYEYLLDLLKNVPPGQRTARFHCVIVVAEAAGRTWQSEGTCEGEIALGPRGTGGFGYDPVFLIGGDAQGRTMAELSAEEKNRISHRGRAAVGAREILKAILA